MERRTQRLWPAFILTGLISTMPLTQTLAAPYNIEPDASIFAVITHKAGLASGLAHNHLIAPEDYEATLEFDSEDLTQTSFSFEFKAQSLVVDSPALQSAWYERVAELGILDEPFSKISESDRGKIREAMLSKKQLDASGLPTIKVRLIRLEEGSSKVGEIEFPHRATIAFTVHGETVEKAFAARCELVDGGLKIEAVARFSFTEFGIKPYSALFGAVKNQDPFHVFVSLEASQP